MEGGFKNEEEEEGRETETEPERERQRELAMQSKQASGSVVFPEKWDICLLPGWLKVRSGAERLQRLALL